MASMAAVALDLDTHISEGGHRIEDFERVQAFALAGRARLRIVSARTGQAINLRIALREGKARYGRTTPQHYAVETDGRFVGALRLVNGTTTLPKGEVPFGRGLWCFDTRASRLAPDCVDRIDWFLSGLLARWSTRELPGGLEVWHTGHCARCGRLLKDPVSVETGFGPDCTAAIGAERAELLTKREALEAVAAKHPAETDWRPAELLPEDYYAL